MTPPFSSIRDCLMLTSFFIDCSAGYSMFANVYPRVLISKARSALNPLGFEGSFDVSVVLEPSSF